MPKYALLTLFLAGCGFLTGRTRIQPDDEETGDNPLDSDVVDTDTSGDAPCPSEMALVDGTFCVDRWEAHVEERDGDDWVPASPYERIGPRTVRAVSSPGSIPQGYISAVEAAAACEASGKRLCSSVEWLASCRSPDGRTWPYGDTYDATACNDTYEGDSHPVYDYFDAVVPLDDEHLNDPGINQQPETLAPTGQLAGCVSDAGVFDLHGNLSEWVDDADGTFRGGFYADAAINGDGCTYVTTAHAANYHDYSTGFRCCMDPR